ncbi:hypothetical protein PCCS19_08000 [Paenibacillus sp. CCS19]|uniref:hypothetical protein n=1 Tax=Paenibacillus sp. CCS19 TaxID=3158387 RepID=UPI00256236B7|nr:hypothetical protein [Paenibacillus cellulosilyticus]GMK37746.1 hypothetical protein PCCS19_08000 [Paenibacillus cellulosilyticus]
MKMKYILIALVFLAAILQACSEQGTAVVDNEAPPAAGGIPLPADVRTITVLNQNGGSHLAHTDAAIVERLLQGMKEAKPSYVSDPEQSGIRYKLILSGSEEKRTFSINDLRYTSADVSVKLYEEVSDGGPAKAWALTSAWGQLLTQLSVDDGPDMIVKSDEDNDSVTLIANRDIDQQSVRLRIESSLMVTSDEPDAAAEYTVSMVDARRVVIHFPNLAQKEVVQFNLKGAKTDDGQPFVTRYFDGSNIATIRQGVAWSGLRWLDTTGAVMREHGFDSALLIEPVRDEEGSEQELLIYNEDKSVYRFQPEQGEIEDITIREWPNDQVKYMSEYGVSTIYSYPDKHDRFFAAQGLQTVYIVDPRDGTKQSIYQSDRPIYGIAASPDGKHVAVLMDTEHIGPDADLVVIDAKGKVVSTFAKAAYINHSEGFHFIYPVRWTDNRTIEVPRVGADMETALYDYKKGFKSNGKSAPLPEDALKLLQSKLGEQDLFIVRALPKPNDEEGRHYAVNVAGAGSYLVDTVDQKVTLLGSGALIKWTSSGQLIVWHSTAGKSVVYIGVD